MRFEKFKRIVEYNRENQEFITAKVRDFYYKLGMNYEKDLLNIMMIVRPLFNKRDYLIIEVPLKDKEIGAICYKNEGSYGYTILNSSLPKVSVNFALAHEIYHVFYQERLSGKKIELYMNEHYMEHADEMSANLFAGILLMPGPGFTDMYNKFKAEESEGDGYITVFCKLMSYFEVPYMAAVIRAYELKLLPDGELLKNLLEADTEQIESEFARLWLDERILCPTMRDDFNRLKELVRTFGEKYAREDLISGATVDKILENMSKIYSEIRG